LKRRRIEPCRRGKNRRRRRGKGEGRMQGVEKGGEVKKEGEMMRIGGGGRSL